MSARSLNQIISSLVFGARSVFADPDEPAPRRIRVAQIDASDQFVPLTMTINLSTVANIISLFSYDGWSLVLTIWGATMVAASFWSWEWSRRRRPKGISARWINCIILYAVLFGGL